MLTLIVTNSKWGKFQLKIRIITDASWKKKLIGKYIIVSGCFSALILYLNCILPYISLYCVRSAGKTDPKTLERVTWVTFVHWVRLPTTLLLPSLMTHSKHVKKVGCCFTGDLPCFASFFSLTPLYLQQQTSAKQACSKRQKTHSHTHPAAHSWPTPTFYTQHFNLNLKLLKLTTQPAAFP